MDIHREFSFCYQSTQAPYNHKTPTNNPIPHNTAPQSPPIKRPHPKHHPPAGIGEDDEYLFSTMNDSSIRLDKLGPRTLLSLFNLDTPLQIPGYTSSSLGIKAPYILGLAPSLTAYHALWRFRYTLEIQLPYLWGNFQARFNWSGINDQAIQTLSLDHEIKVLCELVCLLRLTRSVLCAVYDSDPADCVNSWGFVCDEIDALQADVEVYVEKLGLCLRRRENGGWRSGGREEWEWGLC